MSLARLGGGFTKKKGVQTFMGVKRFEDHIKAIFSTDHKVASNQPKIANASHDDIYVIIFVKILSAGCCQDLRRMPAEKICII